MYQFIKGIGNYNTTCKKVVYNTNKNLSKSKKLRKRLKRNCFQKNHKFTAFKIIIDKAEKIFGCKDK